MADPFVKKQTNSSPWPALQRIKDAFKDPEIPESTYMDKDQQDTTTKYNRTDPNKAKQFIKAYK